MSAQENIAKDRFDPVANKFLSYNPFTLPNAASTSVDRLGIHQNLVSPTKYRSYRTRFDIKFDQSFSPKHKIFGRYSQFVGPTGTAYYRSGPGRLGVAWNARPKLVFRSNFGIITQDLFMINLAQNFEEYFATGTVQAPVGDPRPAFRLSQGPGTARFNIAPDGSAPFVGTNFSGRTASWIDPNIRSPYIMNWSGGVQYEVMNNLLVEAIYQGSAGVGLLNNWDINAIPLNVSNDYATLDNIRRNYQNFRPYPQFGAIQLYSNFGHNTYHSGTLRVERRYHQGLFVNGFYTYSKTLTDADADGGASGVTYYNRRLEKGRANYDVRHRFVGTFVYELPYGKGRRWGNSGRYLGLRDAVLGGWDLMFSQTIQSGPPITVTFAGAPSTPYAPGQPYAWLPMQQRPDQILPNSQAVTQGWSIGPNRLPFAAQNPYLNAAAFAYPAPFTPGTLGRNTFESPGLVWAQASLSKTWRIWESARFQFRWDVNNPFTRFNFTDPNRVFNVANNATTFGRITGTRGGFSDVGARIHSILVVRLEW